MKLKPTGKATGQWCSNCRTDVMCVEAEDGIEHLHCLCTLGKYKTNLDLFALITGWWKGMVV